MDIRRNVVFIDTHAHIDGDEFNEDLPQVMARAQSVGVEKVFVPAINVASVDSMKRVKQQFPDRIYTMIGLHPEDVKEGYRDRLNTLEQCFSPSEYIAIGEVGLDFYWSREFEKEQLEAFEHQVNQSIEAGKPLMIHCRKAQNELVRILRKYERQLKGGVFHCFTGNEKEATELLSFENFALGIGGVLTFKNSRLPEMLPTTVPLDRIVLETDSPYMAPVPHRGKRNEPAYVVEVAHKLAESYGVAVEEVARLTTENAYRIFGLI